MCVCERREVSGGAQGNNRESLSLFEETVQTPFVIRGAP